MMKYALVKHNPRGPRIDITKTEYDQVRKSKDSIFTCVRIEETFDILIDNYIEFETTILHSSLTNSIRFKFDYQEFQSERRLFTRRVINLLTTGRSYIDHINHYVSHLFGDKSKELLELNKIESQQFEEHFGYRVMEKLRNHVQHRGLPIHMISFNFNRIDTDNNFKLLYTITPNLTPKQIEEDEEFNSEVLSEMKEKGKDIDIRPLVREYVEVLSNIHAELRKVLQRFLPEWEGIIFSTIERFQNEFKGVTPLGLELIAEDNGEISDSVSIFTELIESRKYLERKNQNLTNLTKRYVTSEIIEK